MIIDSEHTVGIAIKSKADLGGVLDNLGLECFHMCRTTADINAIAIGFVMNRNYFGSQGGENRHPGLHGCAIG